MDDYEGRLRAEQARMKRELSPRQIERVLEKIRRLEEQELRGLPTLRNPVVPKGVEGVPILEAETDEDGDE